MRLVKLEGVVEVTVRLPTVRLLIVALEAKRLVDVVLVKTEVEGVVPPIAVLLMVPPEMVTFGETRLAMLELMALRVVPEAVAKPNQDVEVPLVKERTVMVPEAELRLAMVPLLAKMLVVEAEVAKRFDEVTFVKLPVEGVVAPIGMALIDPPVSVALPEAKLVDVVLTAVRFVICADGVMRRPRSSRLDPVAFTNMTLPRLVRPVTARLVVVVLIPLALLYVRLVVETVGAERLVMVAPEAKRLVVVTLVPEVEMNWKFWRYVYPFTVNVELATKLPVDVPPPN